jgi:hypothetical protein
MQDAASRRKRALRRREGDCAARFHIAGENFPQRVAAGAAVAQ